MRPYKLTETTRQLLLALLKLPKGPIDRLFQRQRGHFTQLILQVKEADELESVIGLAQLLSGNSSLTQLIANAIHSIIDRRDPMQLAALDDQCRQYSEYSQAVWGWARLSRTKAGRFSDSIMPGLFSMHPNGYIRADAVKQLKQSDHNRSLTFLLLRANDWVKSVRRSAVVEIIRRAIPANIDVFIENLPLIERCTSRTRADFSLARAAIDRLLIGNPDQMEKCLLTADFRLRRSIYTLSKEFDSLTQRRFIQLGLQDSDPLSRLHSARSLAEVTDAGYLREVVDTLVKDSFHAVRLIALRLSLKNSTDFKVKTLQHLLVDSSRSIRYAARFHMLNENLVPHPEYFTQRYREQLTNGNIVAGLFGLGECDSKEDLPTIRGYLNHNRPTVASAALDTVCKLSDDDETELLLEQLVHEFPGCSHTATTWLIKNLSQRVHEKCVEHVVDKSLPLYARRNAFRVALKRNKWSSLEVMLAVLTSNQPDMEDRATSALAYWCYRFNSSFTQPDEGQKERIVTALKAAKLDRRHFNWVMSLVK